MSTTDILLTDILNGLSPPSVLTDINKSIIALQGKLTGAIDKVTGAVDKVTGAVDKVTGAVNLVTQSVDKVTGAIGEASTKIIDALKPNAWVEGINMALSAAGVGVGALAVPGVVATTAGSAGLMSAGAAAGLVATTGLVGLIIAGIVGIGYLVVTYWEDIKALGSKFMDWLKSLGKIVVNAIMDLYTNMKKGFNDFIVKMTTIATILSKIFVTYVLVPLKKGFDDFIVMMTPIATLLSTFFVTHVLDPLKKGFDDFIVMITPIATLLSTFFITNIADPLKKGFDDFIIKIAPITTLLSTFFTTYIVDPIKNGLNDLMDKLKGPITWFFDQIKKLTSLGIGGAIGKLFGGDDSTKQINPDLTKVATVVNTPNKEDLVTNGNKIAFNTSMFGNSSHGAKGSSSSNTNSTHHHQNVYNIANIDIADGMISDLEDLIQAINRHAC